MITGIARKIDNNGRICVPKNIVNELGIDVGDALEFSLRGDEIILKKLEDKCCVCGDTRDNMTKINDKFICSVCADYIKEIQNNG